MKLKNKLAFLQICLLLMILTFLPLTFDSRIISASSANKINVEIISSDLDGNMIEGDCTIISIGDVEILVDCASKLKGNGGKAKNKIEDSMKKLMESDESKVWDYIIFTHPHEDHIGNYEAVFSLLDGDWKIGSIIDFDVYPEYKGDEALYNATTNAYRKKRQSLINNGVNYFSASCLNADNLTKSFYLTSSGNEKCKIEILYNPFDTLEVVKTNINSDGIFKKKKYNNLMSVCFLITIGEQKLLFTGDLSGSFNDDDDKDNGEQSLIKYHSEIIKNVTFFKAGHHGTQGGGSEQSPDDDSPPSNTENFVNIIRPVYVSITPNTDAADSDASILNFEKYTDYIFLSYVSLKKTYYKLYGNQTFVFDGKDVSVSTDLFGFDDDIIPLHEALIQNDDEIRNWYDNCLMDEDRRLKDRLYIYTFDDVVDSTVTGKVEYYNCTLVKYGNIDILIDCGSSNLTSDTFITKLKHYIVDGKIEYLIATNNKPNNISQFIEVSYESEKGKKYLRHGLLDSFEIDYLIDNYHTNYDKNNEGNCVVKYRELTKDIDKEKHITLKSSDEPFENSIVDGCLSISVFGSCYTKTKDENNYSMTVLINYNGNKLLFVGDLSNFDYLVKNKRREISNVSFFRMSNSKVPVKDMESFKEFAKITNPKYIVLGTPLYYYTSVGKYIFDRDDQYELLFNSFGSTYNPAQNIYYLGYDSSLGGKHSYFRANGDLVYYITSKPGCSFKQEIKKISSLDGKWTEPEDLLTFYNNS